MAALSELQPETRAGARLVACAESLGARLAERAAAHDADGTLAFENIAALKNAGFFAAPIPEQFGGMGVDSVHDLLVASSRLARSDAASTIGLNRAWRRSRRITVRWTMAVFR